MRKTLILIVIVSLLALIGFMIFNTLNLGPIQIPGLQQINLKNKELETNIQTLSRLNSTGIEEAEKEVITSIKQYNLAKEQYNEYAEVSKGNNIDGPQIPKYEIEYLWTKFGTHASKNDVVLKFEVEANETSEITGYYDLKITATGDYVSITDFIYDIENDSALGFKIEKFDMKPIGETTEEIKTDYVTDGEKTGEEKQTRKYMKLQTTFTCSNIAINIEPSLLTKNSKTNEENDENQESNNDNQNSTNTNTNVTNTNTTDTNTTNTTNTSNTNTNATN